MKNIIVLMICIVHIQAINIKGIGYANLENESKKEALADLSNAISVNVKSEYKSIVNVLGNDFKKSNEKRIHLSSNLPLIGIEFKQLNEDSLVKTIATLSSDKVLKLYEFELTKLQKNIYQSMEEYKKLKSYDAKYKILNQVLKDIESFNKHKTVAILLGTQVSTSLAYTKSDIQARLQGFLHNIPSMKIASELLTKDINKKNIYISTLKVNGSSQVTQFAKVFKSAMSKYLDTVSKPAQAEYFLQGNYEVLKENIFVTLNLIDKNNHILKTSTVTLDKNAYKHTKYKPSTVSFDESIGSGHVKSGDFFVNIGFKGYSQTDGIDLYEGDTVDIVIKANKPMCYFLLGHVLKNKEKFSYVLPIGSDNTPFLNSLTGEDINRNITIFDEVPISEPFGRENLQIFSSTFDEKGKCPLVVPNCVENKEGFCVVGGKPKDVVFKTRALNLKKKKFKKQSSEDSVNFTSFK